MTTERAPPPRPPPPPRSLGALLPVEAFARSLHSKLRSLGGPHSNSEALDDDNGSSESWSTAHARTLSSSSVDSNSDIFFDLDLSPQSPEEEVTPAELAGMIAGSTNVDQFQTWAGPQSPQSDCSSDYFDPDGFDDDRGPIPRPAVPGVAELPSRVPPTQNGRDNGLPILSPTAHPYECNQCYAIVMNGVTPYEKLFCVSHNTSVASLNGSLNNGKEEGISPQPPSPSPSSSPTSPSKKRPWNRVQHRYKAGTPEAMNEVSQLCLEEAEDEEEKPTAPRTTKGLPKFSFPKSSETRLQEDVIEQLKKGIDIPPELKNGLCPRLSSGEAEEGVSAPCARGLAAMKQVAETLDKLEEVGKELSAGSEDSSEVDVDSSRVNSVSSKVDCDRARVEDDCSRTNALSLRAEDDDSSAEEEDGVRRYSRSEDGDGPDDDNRRPRVRRCSSLKTGKTPPGTPSRKKIVRFADVLGLDLADVRTFLDEIPKVPTSAYSDLQDVESLSVLEPLVPQLSLAFQSSPLAPVDTFGARPTRVLVPLFQQPGGMADFMEKVRERQVCLENAIVKDASLLSIAGQVRVRNLDFHKTVHVRYTTDGWKSLADLQATYVPNSCDGFSDKFTFILFAAHTMSVGQRLEMAIRFQCKGHQYWDNNCGANYCFQCLPPSGAPLSLALHSPDDTWKSFY